MLSLKGDLNKETKRMPKSFERSLDDDTGQWGMGQMCLPIIKVHD